MKEWNNLLSVIDCFIYDFNTEQIVFDDSPKSVIAKQIYDGIIRVYEINNTKNYKWAFDIALDSVRNMSEENRSYLYEEYQVDFHGYGMYLRNRYIHNSRLHHYLSGDRFSSVVLKFIYTILHRYYNVFDEELCRLLEDFNYQEIRKIYSKQFSFIEEEVLKLTQPNCIENHKSILKSIRKKIRDELGRNGFKDIFIRVVQECGKDCLAPQPWLNFINKLYSLAPVYIKEYNQVIALKEVGLIRELVSEHPLEKLSCVADCKAYIDETIGFNEYDAQLLAETLWEAYKT